MKMFDVRNELPKHLTKKYKTRQIDRIRNVVLHHSATDTGGAFSFARYHVTTNNWPGIGYHYVILQDGTMQWCHDFKVMAYHVGTSNGHALGICLVGDYRNGKKPPKAQMDSAIWLCRELKDLLGIDAENFKGHQEMPGYSWKDCPGLNMDEFRRELVMSEVRSAVFKFGDKEYEGRVVDGIAMIPAREFAKDLGLEVTWQGNDKPILIEGGNAVLEGLYKPLLNNLGKAIETVESCLVTIKKLRDLREE